MSEFGQLFGSEPEVASTAPGRANLIGEHTDYSGGFVLPVTVSQCTRVELRRRPDDRVCVHSAQLGARAEYQLGEERRRGDWLDYLQGLTALAGPLPLHGVEARIDSQVPPGAGLASSAALTVAFLRGLRKLFDWALDDLSLARLAQRAEVEFVGAPVGVMDPLACSLGNSGAALFIDTQSLRTEQVPLPASLGLAVVHSGITHAHASGEYRIRRGECEEAARRLGVPSLRAVGPADLPRIADLPPPLDRRARHVVTENVRVLAAVEVLKAGALEELGALLDASHHSLRDDFQVSVPELDELVALARAAPGVYGARLTGGGFGGAILVAAHPQGLRASMEAVVQRYHEKTGRAGAVLVPS